LSTQQIVRRIHTRYTPEDLNIAGLHFHGLGGNPQRWSVRVTANYRITFGWSGENALEVDFEDYH
jgi:proteic killer suppression protein